ncbi:hypothetical protein J6590_095076, partial [Homalodisca vitripennis]
DTTQEEKLSLPGVYFTTKKAISSSRPRHNDVYKLLVVLSQDTSQEEELPGHITRRETVTPSCVFHNNKGNIFL